MPRIYKRKTEPSYTKKELQEALVQIHQKRVSVADAAVHFHIPIRTIYNRLSYDGTDVRPGAKTILTSDEEQLLVHTILLFQKWQCPVTPTTVIHLAKSFMIDLGKTISPNSTLRDWFSGFMRRWSNELKLKKTEKLEKVRSNACRQETINNWFEHLRNVFKKFNLFNRPEALWNVDESGFLDDPGRRSVVIKRTTKHAISSHSGTGKSHTTLVICTSASGELLPPYFIYKGAKMWTTSIPKNGFPGSRYNCTETGWIDEPVFFDWFKNHFIPQVSTIKRPLILFFDGHYAHISVRTVKLAMENGIELECLPAHTTTILQPLDVVTLHKVKAAWRSLLVEHNVKTNSGPIDKQNFALLISELWKKHLRKGHCSSGFNKAGIYPFDPLVVSNDKILVPPTTTKTASATTNTEVSNSGDSARINSSSRRLHRSASCGHLANIYQWSFGTPVYTDLTNVPLQSSSIQFNSPTTTSPLTPMPFISPTYRNTDFLNNSTLTAVLSESQNNSLANITSSDSSQKTIDVLANVIEKYMSSTVSQTSNTKKRKMIERENGESLTTMDVLMRLQQKQQAKQQKNDKPCKTRITASKGTKKRSRTFQNPQQLLNEIDDMNESNFLQRPPGSVSTAIICENNMAAQSNPYTMYSSYSDSITDTTNFKPGQPTYSSYPTCYRCYAIIYTNFSCCAKCNRYCCNQCTQTFFTSNTIFCEYCMIQEALSSTRK
ncbi:unnamed protein product [Rotaria sp. Silwood1]|nr:unnamed protein product [Rotaria sp. Silwood1]